MLLMRLASSLPPPLTSIVLRSTRSIVDHPGVWEDARLAYYNELLIRRVGHPAALTALMVDVFRRLLAMGALDFAVGFQGFEGLTVDLPSAYVFPGLRGRQQLVSQEGGPINTCSSEVRGGAAAQRRWPLALAVLYDMQGQYDQMRYRAYSRNTIR